MVAESRRRARAEPRDVGLVVAHADAVTATQVDAGHPDQVTTWPRARGELQRLHVGTFTGPAGLFRQTTSPSAETRQLHTALDLALPPRILDLDPGATANALTRHYTLA